MTAPLDWYFDVISPFAYLQWRRLRRDHAGVALNPKPVLFAAIRLTHALLPALRESQAGAIVNISSGAATMSVGAIAHYAAAKAALNSYSRALAIDLAPHKVRAATGGGLVPIAVTS